MLQRKQEANLVPQKYVDIVLIVFIYRLCSLSRLQRMVGFSSAVLDFKRWMRGKMQKYADGDDKTIFIRKVKRFVVDVS
ncbi:hypothetical protein EON65_40210 [archaeon]|nr:MAG: hypothetical protein EON65_40210 [archaeon]